MLCSFVRSSFDACQIFTTTRPPSRSSGPTSSSIGSTLGDSARVCSSGFVIKSTDSPRHPAACRALRPGGGDSARSLFLAERLCARTLLLKTASYLRRAEGGTGAGRASCAAWATAFLSCCDGRPLESELREVVPLATEEWSEEDAVVDAKELRFEDGMRLRGGGGGGGGFPCALTAYDTMMVAVEEDEASVPEAPLDGRCGSLGGSGFRTRSAQSVDTDEMLGLIIDEVETFSNDSSRLPLSCSRAISESRSSRSMGYVATKLLREPGVVRSVPPSDSSDTE